MCGAKFVIRLPHEKHTYGLLRMTSSFSIPEMNFVTSCAVLLLVSVAFLLPLNARAEVHVDELKIYELKALADQGDAVAQHNLGVCYFFGKGVPKDMALANEYFLKAAARGFNSAQPKEGSYVDEKDVPMDPEALVKWCREEAKQGNAAAQYRLGNFYFEGIDIPQNHAKAVKWYRRAAEQGHANAQINLGYCYANGKGISKNEVKAAKWYMKAAKQGDAAAQEILSHCSDNGEGITKDELKNVKWFRKATEQKIGETKELQAQNEEKLAKP